MMNKMRHLINQWEANSHVKPVVKEITARLTSRDYARIRALTELYSGLTEEQIVSELLATALDEFEEALPYIPGKKVIAEDEFNDPIYEDIGLTPKFEELTKKYSSLMKEKS